MTGASRAAQSVLSLGVALYGTYCMYRYLYSKQANANRKQLCCSPAGTYSFTWPSPEALTALQRDVVACTNASLHEVKVVVSPYRACPLGAHIDHQGGPVTAVALGLGLLFAFVPTNDNKVTITSHNFEGAEVFSLDDIKPEAGVPKGVKSLTVWGAYARGAAFALKSSGFPLTTGLRGVLRGHRGADGGGISSSAAVGVAFLLALEHVNGLEVSKEENVQLDRCIENVYLGLKNGILDQSAVLLSKTDHLTVIDCRSATHRHVAAPWIALGQEDVGEEAVKNASCAVRVAPPVRFVIAFSGLQKALVGGGTSYNKRVDECASAATIMLKHLARKVSERPLLCEVSPEEFKQVEGCLHGEGLRRAQHFFGECERVRAGVEAWCRGDLEAFGEMMSQSGDSSIYKYECGCPPLIDLREIMLSAPGVLGARFSGAGFRGCCIALVKEGDAETATKEILDKYCNAHPDLAPNVQVLVLDTIDGAHVV